MQAAAMDTAFRKSHKLEPDAPSFGRKAESDDECRVLQ